MPRHHHHQQLTHRSHASRADRDSSPPRVTRVNLYEYRAPDIGDRSSEEDDHARNYDYYSNDRVSERTIRDVNRMGGLGAAAEEVFMNAPAREAERRRLEEHERALVSFHSRIRGCDGCAGVFTDVHCRDQTFRLKKDAFIPVDPIDVIVAVTILTTNVFARRIAKNDTRLLPITGMHIAQRDTEDMTDGLTHMPTSRTPTPIPTCPRPRDTITAMAIMSTVAVLMVVTMTLLPHHSATGTGQPLHPI